MDLNIGGVERMVCVCVCAGWWNAHGVQHQFNESHDVFLDYKFTVWNTV